MSTHLSYQEACANAAYNVGLCELPTILITPNSDGTVEVDMDDALVVWSASVDAWDVTKHFTGFTHASCLQQIADWCVDEYDREADPFQGDLHDGGSVQYIIDSFFNVMDNYFYFGPVATVVK